MKEKLIQVLILPLLLDQKYITKFNGIATTFNRFGDSGC